MSTSQNPCRLLLLDLRQSRCGTLPALAGLEVVNPIPGGNCQLALSALAVFVAIDSDSAYNDWRERYHPMCPSGFPHIVLLDPYNPTLARRALAEADPALCPCDELLGPAGDHAAADPALFRALQGPGARQVGEGAGLGRCRRGARPDQRSNRACRAASSAMR